MHKSRWSPSALLLTKYCIYFIALYALQASAFNIETRLPLMKSGPANSSFGLSIAQHHIKSDSTNPDDAVLLVGAPTADRAPEHSKDSVKPGGLYKCSVFHGQNCTRVVITPPNEEEDTFARRLNPEKVNTLRANSSFQWLGVKVKSHRPGGKIAVCAHRYTIRGGSRNTIAWEAAIGRCFMLENTVVPVKERLSFEWMPCLGKQDNNGAYSHESFGYCQAGTAVDFADFPDPGTDRTENFLVIGAPGSIFWSGAFYTSQLNPLLFPVNLWTNDSPDGVPEKNSLMGSVQVSSASLNLFSPSPALWLPSTSGDSTDTDQIQKNSLLGSSLTSGYLLDGKVNYVSGAPGVNATGAVVIFQNSQGLGEERLEIVETIYGERVATRFGHEVQLVDVTGDGHLDLIVGAPQYYDREEKLGGAVYIYVNKGLKKIGPEPTQILYGNVDSSFGMSIASVGDVNMDGADDIAIGAPGEDGWRGAVYIYHGNNQGGTMGVHEEPSQVIKASELRSKGYLSKNITGFGYSVSAGLDMDFNGYPDLAAGSLSDSIVMFQSRPIVNVAGNIKGPDKRIILGDKLDPNGYDIEICLNYTSTPTTFDDEVVVTANITLDTGRLGTQLLPRASFSKSEKSVAIKVVNMTLYPQSRRRNKCRTIKAYIDKDLQDKLTPIELGLSFNTPDRMPKRRKRDASLPMPMPVMNADIENTASASIKFSKDCGPDEICMSMLSLTAYYEVLRTDWEPISKDEDGNPVLKLGTEQQIGMMIQVVNPLPGEGAHQAELTMELPDVLEYRSIEEIKSTPDLHCDPVTVNETQFVNCDLGNPFKSNDVAQFRVKLSKEKAIYHANTFTIKLQLHTTSQQPGHDVVRSYEVKVHVEAQLDIRGYPSEEQVKFGGDVVGESAVKKPGDAGEMLIHNYEVENSGTGPADNVILHIKWPQTIKNGKWLFYLLKADVRGSAGNCTLPPEVNPLKLRLRSNRQKRSDPVPADSTKPVAKNSAKAPASSFEELICPESASCVEFNCSLGILAPDEIRYISLQAILWNSTFLEEYPGVSQIQVKSSARVSIQQNNIKFSDLSKLDSTVSTSVLAEVVIATEAEIKSWIIVVATLAGVFLLVALVLLLWKCGFFKRRKFGDYQKARRHKQASKKADERETLY